LTLSGEGRSREAAPHYQPMIVFIGESLVDLVLSAPDQVGVHPGGGPFNTARAQARLGQPVSFLGSNSDDAVSLETVIVTLLLATLAFAELDSQAIASSRFYTDGIARAALGRDGSEHPSLADDAYLARLRKSCR